MTGKFDRRGRPASHHCFGDQVSAGISRMSVDLVILDLARLCRTRIGNARHPRVQGKRRIRSGRRAGCPTGRPDGTLRLLPICERIAERELTRERAAKRLGIDRPKMSALKRGELDGFSAERLSGF